MFHSIRLLTHSQWNPAFQFKMQSVCSKQFTLSWLGVILLQPLRARVMPCFRGNKLPDRLPHFTLHATLESLLVPLCYSTFSLRFEKEHLFERGIILFFFFKKKKDIKETNVSLFVERLRIGAQQSQQRAAGCMKARVCLERALSSTIRHGDIQLPISSFSLSEVHVRLCGVAVCVCLFSINSLLLGCLQVCNYSLELTDSG